MISSRQFALATLLGLAVFSVGSPARAGFVTYTVATPAGKLTDFTTGMSIHAFDPSLGSLESVVVSIADESTLKGTVTNNSASTNNFNIKEIVNFGVTFFGSPVVNETLSQEQDNNTLKYHDVAHFGVLNPSTGLYDPYKLVGTTPSTVILDPSILAKFVGTSPLAFSFATASNVNVTGTGGNTANSFTTTADATVTVTYNYISNNITPEPASLVMTAMGGLIAAAGYARCRARKSL